MRALERYLLLQTIDERWREHLSDMDYLREGIHLRGFAQIDPLVAYKNEAYTLFTDLMNTVWSDFARMIFHVEVQIQAAERDASAASPSYQAGGGSTGGASERHAIRRGLRGCTARSALRLRVPPRARRPRSAAGLEPVEQRRAERRTAGRAQRSCWCGSGKKFKRCHGA